MAHFYGTIQGTKGEASRMGDAKNGFQATAAGWKGAVTTTLFVVDGKDYYRVSLTPWANSGGESRVIAEGLLDASQG